MQRQLLPVLVLLAATVPLAAQEPYPSIDTMIERVAPPGEWRVKVLTTRRSRLGVTVNMRARETDSIGALLQSVTPNGPAARAGLRRGDIITSFNRTALLGGGVRTEAGRSGPGLALIELAAGVSPGDTVAIEYRRGKLRRNASLIAGDEPFLTWIGPDGGFGYSLGDGEDPRRWAPLPGEMLPRSDSDEARIESRRERIKIPQGGFFRMGTPLEDLELAPLNPDLGRYFGTSEGVLVIRVPEDSKLGLKAGDVVQAVDGRVPTSPAHLLRILRSYETGEQFSLDIVRMKKRETVKGVLGERSRRE